MRLRTREDVGDVIDRRTRTGCVYMRASECQQVLSPTHNDTQCISTRLSLSVFPPSYSYYPPAVWYTHTMKPMRKMGEKETVFLVLAGRNWSCATPPSKSAGEARKGERNIASAEEVSWWTILYPSYAVKSSGAFFLWHKSGHKSLVLMQVMWTWGGKTVISTTSTSNWLPRSNSNISDCFSLAATTFSTAYWKQLLINH